MRILVFKASMRTGLCWSNPKSSGYILLLLMLSHNVSMLLLQLLSVSCSSPLGDWKLTFSTWWHSLVEKMRTSCSAINDNSRPRNILMGCVFPDWWHQCISQRPVKLITQLQAGVTSWDFEFLLMRPFCYIAAKIKKVTNLPSTAIFLDTCS